MKDTEKYNLSGRELRRILRDNSIAHREFAHFCLKSKSWVNWLTLRSRVPTRWVYELQRFMGKELYEFELKRIRDQENARAKSN